ncbi:MAG: DUF2459 domain-containing protein [Planctomycetes bacterium]|nr:DUF2459 domain-containing protein [Planctomycetota bacterium]
MLATPAAPAPAARPRSRRRRTLLAAALLLAGWLLLGCTSVVTPPRDVRDPVTVLIIRDAMHRGLVLPRAHGYVEYGFGDWSWYAAGADSWYNTFATVLWPTAATLSRRTHAADDPEALMRLVSWAEFDPLVVERQQADRLLARLDADFAAGQDLIVRRADLRMDFVPTAGSYWFPHNCADVCAEWLVELGCEVSWVPIRLDVALGN